MKLPDRLGRRPRKPFHSAIATTFAVEFAAVEEILLPQLMASGATNFLLIADDRMAAMALSDGSRLPIALGRDYALHSPPASEGIFHPKIILQLGRETGRAFVSSANATAAGLGGNVEIAIEIESGSEEGPERELLRAIWQYLHSLAPDEASPARDALRWARERAPWLEGPVGAPLKELGDGSAIGFLPSSSDRGIADQFVEWIGDEKVRKLVIVSPYWDTNLSALSALAAELSPKEIILPVDGEQHEFPIEAAFAKKVRLVDLDYPSTRFTHAKIFVAMTKHHDHVLFGSANCTAAALSSAGANAEACVYRRLPAGAAVEALGLDRWIDADRLELSDLVDREARPEIPLAALAARRPGSFELDQGSLFWQPPIDDAGDGAVQLLDRTGTVVADVLASSFARVGARRVVSIASELQQKLYFARIVRGEFVSTTAHVSHRQALRESRREAASGRVARALSRFTDGTDFELWMHEAFETLVRADFSQSKQGAVIASARLRDPKEVGAGSDPTNLSYEEFTKARPGAARGSGNGANSLAGTYTDSIRDFLNLLTGRGVRSADRDDDGWLDMGDEADDMDDMPDDDVESAALTSADREPVELRTVDAKEFEYYIWAYAREIEDGEGAIGSAEVLRLRYWILLLLYKARCNDLPKGLDCSSAPQSWPRLVVRVLVAFFGSRSPAISRLMLAREYIEMPVDFMECWVTSLWALDTIEALMPNNRANRDFLPYVSKLRVLMIKLLGLTSAELTGAIAADIRAGLDRSIGIRLGLPANADNIIAAAEDAAVGADRAAGE